jgi:predicted RNase H-like HicB family nuclease
LVFCSERLFNATRSAPARHVISSACGVAALGTLLAKRARETMQVPVHIERSASGRNVRVSCPDIPGCSATGRSVDEALTELRRRIGTHFAESAAEPAPPGVHQIVIAL